MFPRAVLFVASVTLCVSLALGQAVPSPPYKTLYLNVSIDHFNVETQSSTFSMRYLVNEDSWRNDPTNPGPIIFYTGNEGGIEGFWDNTGFAFELAAALEGLVVFGEHRFYGESLPFGETSWERGHIGYLSVEQALADFAVLINHLQTPDESPYPHAQNSKVIALGGSYGGMLSAWIRIKYPHLIDAALAASAPLHFNQIPNFFQAVTEDFSEVDARCPDIARRAFTYAQTLAQSGTPGLQHLSLSLNLCSPLQLDQLTHLNLWAINAFTTLTMGDYPYPTTFLGPLPGFPVKTACEMLLQAAGGSDDAALSALSSVIELVYNNSGKCHDIYAEFVECADQTGCGTSQEGKSWDYQACSELIFFPGTTNVTDMFPAHTWNVDTHRAYCQQTWGITPDPRRSYWLFGDAQLSSASNIIFSNGLLDPWRVGGIFTPPSASTACVTVADGAHHLDLRGTDPRDPASVTEARQKELAILKGWLGL